MEINKKEQIFLTDEESAVVKVLYFALRLLPEDIISINSLMDAAQVSTKTIHKGLKRLEELALLKRTRLGGKNLGKVKYEVTRIE